VSWGWIRTRIAMLFLCKSFLSSGRFLLPLRRLGAELLLLRWLLIVWCFFLLSNWKLDVLLY
jgi:hypothetical protein